MKNEIDLGLKDGEFMYEKKIGEYMVKVVLQSLSVSCESFIPLFWAEFNLTE